MVAAASLLLAALCTLSNLASVAEANAFLGRVGPPTLAMLPLLEELEKIVGGDHRGSTEGRAIQIEDVIRPTFTAMPKTLEGGVKPDAVRYMVHRYFVDRHGWFVDGLGSGADVTNTSSPASIFKGQGDDDVQELFEARFQKHSFTLHQVSVFAATLESFVHTETVDRLTAAYRVAELSKTSIETTDAQIKSVLDDYMMLYITGANFTKVRPKSMQYRRSKILEAYPTWEATKKWVGEVHREVLDARDPDGPSPTSFDFSTKVLEEISDRYGRWQNHECLDLKHSLLKIETPGTGRVRLGAFYESALQGNWQFSETIDYLRDLGALDESDPQRPAVIIPNYINAPSNCKASSKFYSVCCIDECESLISHLETSVAAPEASSQRIADLVAALPSPTVQAPRTLSASLVQRLEEIASHHHGTVPFHGRLFGQWMHHAYPRECSYPHLSGTLNPQTDVQRITQTGISSVAEEEDMKRYVDSAKQVLRSEEREYEIPWSAEEELFVSRQQPSTYGRVFGFWAAGKGLAGLGVIFSVIVTVLRTLSSGKHSTLPFAQPNQKYFV